jgi:hypothetical protein
MRTSILTRFIMNITGSLLAIPALAALFVAGVPAMASGFPEVQQGYDLMAPAPATANAHAVKAVEAQVQPKVEKPSAAANLPFMNRQAPNLPFLNRAPADLPFLKQQTPDLPFLKQQQQAQAPAQKRPEPVVQHDPVIENSIFAEKVIDGIPLENDKISAELATANRKNGKPDLPKTEMGLLAPGSKYGYDGPGDQPGMYGGQMILPSTRLAPVGGADGE